MKLASFTLSAIALLGAAKALAQSRGVSKTGIVIGTIRDLSGPIAAFGKQSRNGMQSRVDEINEQGGINGRQLKLLVEDSAYDPKRAVLVAEAGQPGQDLPDGRPHRHGAQQRGDGGAVREERRQLPADHGSAREVRDVPQAQVLLRRDLLRPDPHRAAEPDMFDPPRVTCTATKRLGNDLSHLSQLVDGRWKLVSAYVKP